MTEDLTPLDVLRVCGWHKGAARSADGRVCLVTAMSEAQSAFEVIALADEVAAEQFPERVVIEHHLGSLRPAAQVNDHPLTTLEDVEMIITKAELRYAEKVQ